MDSEGMITWLGNNPETFVCIRTDNYYCCSLPSCSWSHCASFADISLYGVATDGSDHLAVKLFPVLIHYFDWKNVEYRQLFHIHSKPNDVRLPAAKL